MKVGCYVRVSTVEQYEQGYSVGEQQERLKKYCDAMGWEIYNIYTDGGFTGANINRPALQELIRDIKKLDKVVVYKLDRLSRSQKDTLYLIEDVFLANGCDFISMSENFDTSTPFGKAMIGILSCFAQLERETIKERMKMGKSARAKKGLYHGSCQVPIGYDYTDGKLVTNESEKEQIIRIYEMYAQGYSPAYIVEYLNSNGYCTKYGKWHRSTITALIPKKTYLGFLAHNGEWFKGEHEAFITEDLYNSCMAMHEEKSVNNKKYQRRETKGKSLLGGLIICGLCGQKFSKRTNYYTTKEGRKPREYYGCKRRIRNSGNDRCINKCWKMVDLDNLVLGEIRKLKLEPVKIAPPEVPKIDKQLEKIDKQISRLIDLYSLGNISKDDIQAKIDDLSDKKELLIKNMSEAKKAEIERKKRENALLMIDSLDTILDSNDFELKKALVNALIEKIVINRDDVTIYWTFN